MKLRESISVGTQISILPGITLVGFILVLILQYAGLSNQAKVNETNLKRLSVTDSLQNIQQQITSLRVSEKNLFATGKIEYSVEHKRALHALFATINGIQTDQNPIIDDHSIQQWREMLNNYQNVFLAASREQEMIGYSENTGLRGSMRNAIHDVEARIKDDDPALMRDMLSMRRHEKNYIVRGDEKFFRKWLTSIAIFYQATRTADLSVADRVVIPFETNLYVSSFRQLVTHKRKLAHSLVQADMTSSTLLRSIGLAFTKSSVYARDQIQSHYHGALSEFRNIAILTLMIGLLAVFTSRWIGGGIRSSFKLITTAMAGLARHETNTRIPATSYSNEIGEMANALQVFRENEKRRLLAEINLKSAKRQTENIVKTMYEGLFEIDAQGKIISTNPAASHLLGVDEDDVIGQNVSTFFTQSDENESTKSPEAFLQMLLSGKSRAPVELRVHGADEMILPVACSCGILMDRDNRRTGAILTFQDITQRKAAERAKSEFLSTVSHELRTPLTSIKGALGVMDSGALGELNEKLQKMVSIALTNSNRLVALINDILDFEKIEAGQLKFYMEPMDITKLVIDSIESNEGYATTYGVNFEAKGATKPIMVAGDKNRLMQVMSNLLSNAAKFSVKGGVVEVSLGIHESRARISVKDTGSGIPRAAQATIFNRFTQADSSDQRKKGGTGLGLNIVKNMVEAHGGNISFDSVEGKGTTFYFDLDILSDEMRENLDQVSQNHLRSKKPASDLHPCERSSAACIATVRRTDGLDPPGNSQNLNVL